MEITLVEKDKCKYEVDYKANALEILEARGKVLDAFRNAPVKGFRQGKASLDAIKFHYAKQIEDSLKKALIEKSFHNTLFEKNLKPHGPPDFKEVSMVDGKFSCKFEMNTKPTFELAQYENLEMPAPHVDIDEVKLAEKMLQELRVRFGEIDTYDENSYIQDGDKVIVNYESEFNGEKLPQLCAEGEIITVGQNSIEFINENILGMKLNETREFDFIAPESSLPSIAGKLIHFKITLVTGSKTTPCALDQTLADKLNMKDFDEVRDFVKKAAAGKFATHKQNLINEAVSAKLVELNKDFEIPGWMSVSEAKYIASQSKIDWNSILEEDKAKFVELAEKNVRLALVLDKIAEDYPEAQLSDTEVMNMIKQNLSRTKSTEPMDKVLENMSQTGYLSVLFARIKNEYALNAVVKTVKFME